jgi:hypothetical protein
MRSSVFSRTREGSSILSLAELFRKMPHFSECCIYFTPICAIVTTVLLLLSYTCLSIRFLVAHFSVCLYLVPH